MAVDTKRVTGRRVLHFDTLDEVLRDAEDLASRPHRQLGNYPLGRICTHLAQGMDYCLDGYPPAKVPRLLRLLGALMKRSALRKPPPAGLKMPRAFQAMFTPPEATAQEGLSALRNAVARMKAEPQRHPSPMFGRFTREEWDAFHCRHAELHLSFLVPEP